MQIRNCVICGIRFRPTFKGQRAHNRECGIKLQALVHAGKAPRATAYDPVEAKRYGSAYKKVRDLWKIKVDRGEVWCSRPTCGKWIAPGAPWDLGHDDDDPSVIRGPEHRKCNRSTATHKAKRRQRWRHPIEESPRTSRQWYEPSDQ